MTTRKAAKAKGRRLERHVVERLLDTFPDLTEDDVKVVPASVSGEDIHFSAKARDALGVSVECKARAKIAVYEWVDQCVKNCGGRTPVTVIKADRKKALAILDLEDLLTLLVAARG